MNDTKLNEEVNEQIAYDNYKKRLKPLYLLIKLDVDGEIALITTTPPSTLQTSATTWSSSWLTIAWKKKKTLVYYIGGEEDNEPLLHST